MHQDRVLYEVTAEALLFLRARHLATLTTLRPDGTPHVTPVGFTFDPVDSTARVICDALSRKARNIGTGGRVALCQVDGRHWLTLEGVATVSDDPADVADAVARYAARYRQPRINPTRVVIRVGVQRLLGTLR